MKITAIKLAEITVPLKKPFTTALRQVTAVNDIVVKVHTDQGLIGYGEAAPTAVITGETKSSITEAIRAHLAPALIGLDIRERDVIFERLDKAMVKNTSAKAALDMAIYDLFGQLYAVPLYQLLGGYRKQLIGDITISVNSPDEMAKDSLDAIQEGFKTLKIKLGKDASVDLARLSAVVNAVGQDIKLRLDANQGWTPQDAVRILGQIENRGFNIEFVEQPVPAHDLKGLKYVKDHTELAIMADEALFSPDDALRILDMQAADILNIKLMKCGGIHQALKICALAEAYGQDCMLGCMMESRLSVNAAAHLAASQKVIRYIDLDGPILCAADPVQGGSSFNGPDITLSKTPGLGVSGVEGLVYLD